MKRIAPTLRDLALATAAVLLAALPPLLNAAPETHASGAGRPTAMSPPELRQLLASIPAGNPVRGQQLHTQQFCAACHGTAGVAPTPNWPHLAGQRVAYTVKMLVDYQRGHRAEHERARLMANAVHGLTLQDMADLAAWYARLPAPVERETPRPAVPPAAQAEALRLVRHGDAARLITPCASCHGARGQGGVNETPALAGQNPQYFVRTMQLYHGQQRANDTRRGMRSFAARLSAAEVAALATYYADLPASPGTHRR